MFSCSIFNPRVFEAGVSLLKYERRFQSQISMWTGVHKLKETLLLSFGSWHENRRMRFFFPFGFQHCHHLQLSVWFKTGSGSSGLINTARHRGGGAECLGSTSPREWCWCIWSSYIVSHRNRAAPPPPLHTHTSIQEPPQERTSMSQRQVWWNFWIVSAMNLMSWVIYGQVYWLALYDTTVKKCLFARLRSPGEHDNSKWSSKK